jgi:hypothetical protein
MKSLLRLLTSLLATSAPILAKSVTLSQRVVRDGSASLVAWSGADKDLAVTGAGQPATAWLEFDRAPDSTASAVHLDVFVRSTSQSGTLQVYALTQPVQTLENGTQAADLSLAAQPAGNVTISAGTTEQLLSIPLSGKTPHGVALVSNDGLVARISAKESGIPAQLTYTIQIADAQTGPVGPRVRRDRLVPRDRSDPKDRKATPERRGRSVRKAHRGSRGRRPTSPSFKAASTA